MLCVKVNNGGNIILIFKKTKKNTSDCDRWCETARFCSVATQDHPLLIEAICSLAPPLFAGGTTAR